MEHWLIYKAWIYNLILEDGVKSYLSQTPFASTKVTTLEGGAMNFTYRITLDKPYLSPPSGNGTSVLTAILKHAEPFPSTYRTFPIDVQRQDHEITAFTEIPKITSPPSVYIPKVYSTDLENHVLIMEDCGEGSTDLKEHLRYKSLPLDTARRLGNDLGQFLAEIHLASHESQAPDSFPVQLKNSFAKNHIGRAMSSRITYGVILDESRLPSTFPNVDEIRALARAAQDTFMSTNEVIVMGDFSPRNMLVCGEVVERIGVVDWEFVRPGFPGADIGEFMAELYALRKFYPSCSEAVEALGSAFISRYKSLISTKKSIKLDEIARTALLHAGAHLFGVTRFAQPKWGSDEEIQQISLEGLDIILTGNNDDSQWYSKCLLDELLI